METNTVINVARAQLETALLRWELNHRAGLTRTSDETAGLPPEQVARESADALIQIINSPEVSDH